MCQRLLNIDGTKKDVHNKFVKSRHKLMELCWIICLHSLEGAYVGRVSTNECVTVKVCPLANAGLVLIYPMVNLR